MAAMGKGKINSADLYRSVTGGTPVRVLLVPSTVGDYLAPANRKTGVLTLAVLDAQTRTTESAGWSRRATRAYRFRTSAGWTGWCAPIQTFMLAPEDAPAVKRARAEALVVDQDREDLDAAIDGVRLRIHRAAQEARDAYRMGLIERIMDRRNQEEAEALEEEYRAEWDSLSDSEQASRALAAMEPAQVAHEERQRAAVGAVPAFAVNLDSLNAKLRATGKDFQVTPEDVAKAGMTVMEPDAVYGGSTKDRVLSGLVVPARRITPEECGTIAVVQSGPHAGSVVRTGTAMERPFLAPVERPEQEPQRTTDARLAQLLALLDDGTVFELHPDGWWRDQAGLTGSLLDTQALSDAVNAAYRAGLVAIMGEHARYMANPVLRPAPIHQAVAVGSRYRPLCGSTPYDRMGPIRRRYTHRAVQVTCPACIDMAAESKRHAEALAQKIRERGIVVDAVVTIHRGVQRYTVVRIEEDMVQVAPDLSEEDRASIEAAGGVIRELQWVSWDLLHAVPAEKNNHA